MKNNRTIFIAGVWKSLLVKNTNKGKNLIVMINNKPTEKFQYVKVLTVDELLGFIKHFKPGLSKEGTQEIAEYLVKINI